MTCIILDPGHGGISPGGHYLTRGKQSPSVPPGIYEGEFNRDIVARVHSMLSEMGILSVITAPGPMSPRESDRIAYANALHAVRGDCVYVAIHGNAEPGTGWGDAHGTTVIVNRRLTPMGWKLSDAGSALGWSVLNAMSHVGPDIDITRGVRGRRLHVLRATRMPAILIECEFMTNWRAAARMANPSWRGAISAGIALGLQEGLV